MSTGRSQTRPNAEAAFTLLEVMVCLVIIAIGITAFLTAITQNVQLEAMNSETKIAINAAQAVIETARTMTYAELSEAAVGETFVATGLTNDGQTLRLTSSEGSDQVGSVTITENPAQTTKTVQVAVVWRSITGGDRRIMLMTEVTSY